MRRRAFLAALWPRRGKTILGGTFIQFWRQHREWPAARWDDLFYALQGMSLSEVAVQWSAWGDEDYTGLVEGVVNRAEKGRMGVWLGLWQDPAYWEIPDLDRIRTRSLEVARVLEERFTRNPAFRGWYLPEEIDDGTWSSSGRRELLRDHLRLTVARLRGKVAAGAFTNGHTRPEDLAAFWKGLLGGTGIRELWFQDGIGAGKMSLETWAPRLERLRRSGIRVRPVVELFERARDQGFRAAPAPFERVVSQLHAAGKHARLKPFGFSVPDYWWEGAGEEAGRRAEAYRAWLAERSK